MNNANNILSTILDCGTADIDFLIEELENWHVDFNETWAYVDNMGMHKDINALIEGIYQTALTKALNKFPQLSSVNIDKICNGFYPNCDSLFSTFELINIRGETEEICDYDELIDFIAKFIADSK